VTRDTKTEGILAPGQYCVGDSVGRVSGALSSGPVRIGDLVVECAGATETGRRPTNDDEFLLARIRASDGVNDSDDAQVMLVADGMGGLPCSQVASCIATHVVYRQLERELPGLGDGLHGLVDRLSDVAQHAFSVGEHALAQLAEEGGYAKTPGTTLTAAIVFKSRLLWMHAGDSRCYLLREGALTQLTSDHNVFALIKQAGVARVNPALKSYLTNCIGADTGPVRVDVGMEPLRAGDWILVCSDGLTNTLSEPHVQRLLTSQDTQEVKPAEIARSLVQAAIELGAKDNVTVTLARVS
jgi:serine/threonine protein phosphatase PrpC